MKTILASLITFIMTSNTLFAASLGDSILEIPEGTTFTLRNELEIPANQDFFILGHSQMDESFNEINQSLNDTNNINDYDNNQFYSHNNYINTIMRTTDQSYQACLERHIVNYSYGGPSDSYSNSGAIINNGNGNTNIIVNQGSYNTAPTYGSYLDNNSCVKPERSAALLIIDKNKAGSGGLFREGYKFKVSSVRHQTSDQLNIITISFDHKIAKGIKIITTHSAEKISINNLSYQESGSGFLAGLGSAINSMTELAGDNFIIVLPELEYYE